METTAELPLKIAGPEVSQAEIDALCAHLLTRDWQTAAQIAAELGIDDRRVRAIAEHSDGRILSGPGCPGYKLFTGATQIGEADQCAGRLESQARKMLLRAASIRRRYHRYAQNTSVTGAQPKASDAGPGSNAHSV